MVAGNIFHRNFYLAYSWLTNTRLIATSFSIPILPTHPVSDLEMRTVLCDPYLHSVIMCEHNYHVDNYISVGVVTFYSLL